MIVTLCVNITALPQFFKKYILWHFFNRCSTFHHLLKLDSSWCLLALDMIQQHFLVITYCPSVGIPVTIGPILFSGYFYCFLFCLNSWPIPLPMVNIWIDFVENLIYEVLQTYFGILDENWKCSLYPSQLSKDLHTYSLLIREMFLDIKRKNGLFLTLKKLEIQNVYSFYTTNIRYNAQERHTKYPSKWIL